MECAYKIVGDIQVPEERKEELNANVLKLLKAGGIRKVHKIKVAGKTVEILREPEVDEEGQIYFNYSIFEQRKREMSRYDTNTCLLYTEDRGYEEFGVIMNLILAMQEAYSQSLCYLMYEVEICSVWGYAVVLEKLIGVNISFPNRGKLWEMYLFFKKQEKYAHITYKDIKKDLCLNGADIRFSQLEATLLARGIGKEVEKTNIENNVCIKEMKANERVQYVYSLMEKYIEQATREDIEKNLKILLDATLPEREKTSSEAGILGELSEISLYSLPPIIVAAYAHTIEEEFWQVWFRLGIEGYVDVCEKEEDIFETQIPKIQCDFYKILQRDNEDDFIEFWNGKDMLFSTMLQDNFRIWRGEFDSINDETVQGIQAEEYLANLILDMYGIWDACIVKDSLIQEVIQHKDIIPYKKALLLLNKLLNADIDIFPELTSEQVLWWYSKRNKDKVKQKNIKDYVAMITNGLLRKEILGF